MDLHLSSPCALGEKGVGERVKVDAKKFQNIGTPLTVVPVCRRPYMWAA